MTNYLYDAFRGGDSEPQERPPEEMANLLSEIIPGLDINQQDEPGFEVITRVRLRGKKYIYMYTYIHTPKIIDDESKFECNQV